MSLRWFGSQFLGAQDKNTLTSERVIDPAWFTKKTRYLESKEKQKFSDSHICRKKSFLPKLVNQFRLLLQKQTETKTVSRNPTGVLVARHISPLAQR